MSGRQREIERRANSCAAAARFATGENKRLASKVLELEAELAQAKSAVKELRDEGARQGKTLDSVRTLVSDSRMFGWRHEHHCAAQKECGPLRRPDVDHSRCDCYVARLYRFEMTGEPRVQG